MDKHMQVTNGKTTNNQLLMVIITNMNHQKYGINGHNAQMTKEQKNPSVTIVYIYPSVIASQNGWW